MSNVLLNAIENFFVLALAAITLQNIVFSRAIGVSELMSLIDDTTSTFIFGTLLTSVNLISGVLYYFFYTEVVSKSALAFYFRPLSMLPCALVAFIIVYIIAIKFAAYENINRCVQAMPLATFNCTVIGTLLLTTSRQFTLGGTIGFNLGSSIGYILAVILVTEGRRRIKSSEVPAAFRGLPIMLLYIAGLALAVYGLTGYSFSF